MNHLPFPHLAVQHGPLSYFLVINDVGASPIFLIFMMSKGSNFMLQWLHEMYQRPSSNSLRQTGRLLLILSYWSF